MLKTTKSEISDGRRLRTERSRLTILNAAMTLQDAGNLVPTAQQISDQAGISIRSFFRHFEDMESLFEAGDVHIRTSYEALFLAGERGGTLEERVEHAVQHRVRAYEAISKLLLAVHAQLWRYKTLRKSYARNQLGLRSVLDDWLPELKSLPREKREAVDAITSFEMWNRLRVHQGLSKRMSTGIVTNMLQALVSQG